MLHPTSRAFSRALTMLDLAKKQPYRPISVSMLFHIFSIITVVQLFPLLVLSHRNKVVVIVIDA